MGAATDGVSFPVIFFDSERESEMGNIFVNASLSFKTFQSMLSRLIGISPHQTSVYLVDRKRSRFLPRKIPITSKVDFSDYLHEKDCVFFAVLKRSRRERRRRAQKDSAGYEIGNGRSKKVPAANVMLLRRSAGADSDRPFSVLVGYETYARRVEMGFRDLRLDGQDTNSPVSAGNGGLVVCDECLRAEKMGKDFHWCVYDTVTVGFRSPAGPISRPGKGSG